jgi:thiol-disulfide isomerase/thioredoxin
MKRDWKKHISTIIFAVFVLVILFVPAAKAKLIQSLMEIGLFKPDLAEDKNSINADLSAIKFKDVNGNVLNLADLKGKIIFLNFWATWCPPCLAEMPSINKFYEQYKNDQEVVFLMIDADSDFAKAHNYLNRKNYKFKVYTFASDIPKTIFSGKLPTTIVFDKKGRIAMNGVGPANYASKEFLTFIQKLKDLKE